jgi:hypothetical protein
MNSHFEQLVLERCAGLAAMANPTLTVHQAATASLQMNMAQDLLQGRNTGASQPRTGMDRYQQQAPRAMLSLALSAACNLIENDEDFFDEDFDIPTFSS